MRIVNEGNKVNLEARIVAGVATQLLYEPNKVAGSVFCVEYGILDHRWPHIRMALSVGAANQDVRLLLALIRAEAQNEGTLNERRALSGVARSRMLNWSGENQNEIGPLLSHVPLPTTRSLNDKVTWTFLGTDS
ncbi:MAG: hypothetical protein Q8L53_14110 [Aestuariivirga sp.]|nr:hypothetical protein [Aestuariivirga sp.]